MRLKYQKEDQQYIFQPNLNVDLSICLLCAMLIESNKEIFRNKITAQDTLRSFADPPGTVKLPSK